MQFGQHVGERMETRKQLGACCFVSCQDNEGIVASSAVDERSETVRSKQKHERHAKDISRATLAGRHRCCDSPKLAANGKSTSIRTVGEGRVIAMHVANEIIAHTNLSGCRHMLGMTSVTSRFEILIRF